MAVNKRKILASAQKHLQKGAFDRALKDYQTVLKADPRDSNVRLKVGDILLRQGSRDEAIAAYRKVAEQFMHDGFDAKAVAIYKQITKIDDKRYDVYVPLAELYQRMGLSSEAMSAIQTAADGYHREGRKREALELLRKLSELDPTNTTSRLKIADVLRQEEMLVDAVAEYEAVAAECERQRDREGLITACDRILEIEPDRLPTLKRLVGTLMDEGDAERAEPFACRVAEAEPDDPASHELLAKVYTKLHREDALAETYRKLAGAYRSRGEEDKARDILQRFVPPEPFRTDSGDASLDFGEGVEAAAPGGAPQVPDDALPELEPIDLGGDAVEEVEQMLAEASVYLRYGKHEKAIASLELILQSHADHLAALEKLGEAWASTGDNARASEVWLQAVEVARAQGEASQVSALRDRIAAIDSEAAAQVDAASAADSSAADEPTAHEAADDEQAPDSEDEPLEAPGPEESAAPAAEPEAAPAAEPEAAPAAAEADSVDLEIDIDVDLSDLEGEDSASEALAEGEAEHAEPGAADAASTSTGAEASAQTRKQIAEQLEEGDFYLGQGLHDEAQAIFERVLSLAPDHPLALLRLGEIDAARGGDAGPSEAGGEPSTEQAAGEREPDPSDTADDVATWDESDSEPAPPAAAGAEEAAPSYADEEGEAEIEPEGSGEADFDLAQELSDHIGAGGAAPASASAGAATARDGIDAILHEFKKGVQETLGEGDLDTHYDLGIAYREMGLLEDAIGEFRVTLGSSERRLDSLQMLGLCSLEVGRPQDAVAHFEQALTEPAMSDDQRTALRFDLGRAYEDRGDLARALSTYEQVAANDSEFRDVSERLAALRDGGGTDSHAEHDDTEEVETFASFDDVITDAEAALENAEASKAEPSDVAASGGEADPPEAAPGGASRKRSDGPRGKKRRRKISFV